ncbi:MAG: SUMF1/EgtB/PvdO family nonheme iron enzyme [Gammaproteobacteria bacterium]|nr:SUMF1/EgtB/PvdO family nonheme iron enzyme [Gammaproteobacteria bacterium]
MLKKFPFQAFFTSLAPHIRPTVRDYERIGAVLQGGGEWTLAQFRDALLALLAKSPEQRTIFLRRFHAFFTPETEADKIAIDVQRTLADLNALAQTPRDEPVVLRAVKHPPQKESDKKNPVWRLWLLSFILLCTAAGAGVFFFLQPPGEPRLCLSADALDFGLQATKGKNSKILSLENCGTASLRLGRFKFSGTRKAAFTLEAEPVKVLLPEKSLDLPISFYPQAAGEYQAVLEITRNGLNTPQRVALRGSGFTELLPPSPEPKQTAPIRERLYKDVPYIKNIRFEPFKPATEWQKPAGIAAFLLLLLLLYAFHLWRGSRIPEVKTATYDKTRKRHFPLGSIGGRPAPRLSGEMLDEMADFMGYFDSELPGNELNISATIDATLRQQGILALAFNKRKQVRALMILEDAFAEAAAWNPIAAELAAGMQQRGVPVVHGRFAGSPVRFKTEDGLVHHLEDWEDQCHGFLVLVFSESKGVRRFALESLARWNTTAWLDLREPRFWDEFATLPKEYRIPLYPATPAGVLLAIKRYLTEQSASADDSLSSQPHESGGDRMPLASRVEHLLGDAFLWAQDCALLQPVTPGLADALRQRFHPQVAQEAIERLYRLPGTVSTVSGLTFSGEVQKILRRFFLARRSDTEQEAVLRFLLAEIDKAKPAGKEDTLATLAWEFVREKVRFELEPDDVERLAQLEKTPLSTAINEWLGRFSLPGDIEKFQLRRKPQNRETLQKLARFSANPLSVARLAAFPGHWLLLELLCLVLLGFSGQAIKHYLHDGKSDWSWSGSATAAIEELSMLVEYREKEKWRVYDLAQGDTGIYKLLDNPPLMVETDYRVTLYGDGEKTVREFRIDAPVKLEFETGQQDIQRPCLERFDDIGLSVRRCAGITLAQMVSWRMRLAENAPENRLLSIGLEIAGEDANEGEMQGLRDTLLDTGSVDVLYRLRADKLARGWERLQQVLGVSSRYSQFIVFFAGQMPDVQAAEEAKKIIRKLDGHRGLTIGQWGDAAWVPAFIRLLAPGMIQRISEREILAALNLDDAAVAGNGMPVLLLRPLDTVEAVGLERKTISNIWRKTIAGVEFKFSFIKGGSFSIGCHERAGKCYHNEKPAKIVQTGDFYLAQTEVTQGQWKAVTGDNPSHFKKGDNYPVENVSWLEARKFIDKLNELTGNRYGFRLPVEAEWEYAARNGGEKITYPWGDEAPVCNKEAANGANFWDCSKGKDSDSKAYGTQTVGSYAPNKLGLYDMAGNVWEWTCSEYTREYQGKEMKCVGKNHTNGSCVIRGGSWGYKPRYVRSAVRDFGGPDGRNSYLGFRLARIE